MTLNIAIDGPSGAGKSTIAKLIAKNMGITYLDTGAMYRGLAYFALKNGVEPNDEAKVLPLLDTVSMDIEYNENGQKVIVNGEDVTPFIREHHISMAASTISKIHAVRLKLADLQRQIAKKTDCVLDGRDIGSFVLPNANVKIYMDASAEVRAIRRKGDLEGKGDFSHTYEEILEDIKARDYQDMNRDFAPLKVADGATVIDTSYMTIDEVASAVINLCKDL
ncbi:MAG: (d)CMP kinase [Clostridia bacterium]|nr:(d)CMP kinase [Clostridia bacterium]